MSHEAVRHISADYSFEFRHGMITAVEHRQSGRRTGSPSWRGLSPRLAVVVITITALTKRPNVPGHLCNAVLLLSCGAKRHNIPQSAQLARALPPIQKAHSVEQQL